MCGKKGRTYGEDMRSRDVYLGGWFANGPSLNIYCFYYLSLLNGTGSSPNE